MKQIEIDHIEVDEIAAALAETSSNARRITGYVVSRSDNVIAIATERGASSWTEYPTSRIDAAFAHDEAGLVSILVGARTNVRKVSKHRVDEVVGCCSSADTGPTATLQPRDKMHWLLGELDRIRREARELLRAMPCEFGCGAARIDCLSAGGETRECNRVHEECLRNCGWDR